MRKRSTDLHFWGEEAVSVFVKVAAFGNRRFKKNTSFFTTCFFLFLSLRQYSPFTRNGFYVVWSSNSDFHRPVLWYESRSELKKIPVLWKFRSEKYSSSLKNRIFLFFSFHSCPLMSRDGFYNIWSKKCAMRRLIILARSGFHSVEKWNREKYPPKTAIPPTKTIRFYSILFILFLYPSEAWVAWFVCRKRFESTCFVVRKIEFVYSELASSRKNGPQKDSSSLKNDTFPFLSSQSWDLITKDGIYLTSLRNNGLFHVAFWWKRASCLAKTCFLVKIPVRKMF